MTNTDTGAPLAAEMTTVQGETAYRVPLSGRDGAGKFALVDAEGLQRLRNAGARSLYLVTDGHQNAYVTFVRFPTYRSTTASRSIIEVPKGRRVVYRNGDRLDLRTANLMVQPRKDDAGEFAPAGQTAAEVNNAWQQHNRLRRQSEGEWKRPPSLAQGRFQWG